MSLISSRRTVMREGLRLRIWEAGDALRLLRFRVGRWLAAFALWLALITLVVWGISRLLPAPRPSRGAAGEEPDDAPGSADAAGLRCDELVDIDQR